MPTDIFSIRLREARQMMGYSMERLSSLTRHEVTKQSISKYESGKMLPRGATLKKLAQALDISADYFAGRGMQIDKPMLRNAFKTPLEPEETQRLVAMLSFWAEQYVSAEKRTGMETPFVNPLADTEVDSLENVSAAADRLRQAWNLGSGVIPSILRLMERKGIKILNHQLPMNVLGLSTWADGAYPLVVIDMSHEKHTVERLRFTAAHELGHIVLNIPDGEKRETYCNQFAGCFLLPKSTLYEEIGCAHRDKVTLEELIDLHEAYGLSVSALVHELKDFDIIDEKYYHWWYDERINKNPKEVGWGEYLFPETIGREKRVRSNIKNNNLKQ